MRYWLCDRGHVSATVDDRRLVMCPHGRCDQSCWETTADGRRKPKQTTR